jgi:WD40 repeat protein
MLALICLLTALNSAAPGELLLEEQRLATIPEGIELEGEPVFDPDGNEWPNVNPVRWSPDGRRVAYVGIMDGKTHAVIGDEVLKSYDLLGAPIFSYDGEHVAFRAGNRRTAKQEKWHVLLDGKEVGNEDWIGLVAFRPGSDELCYWTQPGARIGSMGEYTGGDLVFRAGKQKGKQWDDANALLPVAFSSDGSVIASPAQRKGAWHVMRFDKKGERKLGKRDDGYSLINSFALSPDGKDVAVCCPDPRASGSEMPDLPPGTAPPAGMFGMHLVVMHGKDVYGRDEHGAGQPVFSPNGKHLAYKLKTDDGMTIGVDGKSTALWPDSFVHTPVWSPDSKRFAYAVTEGGTVSPFWELGPEGDTAIKGGKTRMIVSDRRGKDPEIGEEYLEVRDVAWTPDGDTVTFRARTDDGWVVVCGERVSPVFDEVGAPVCSQDGSKVCFGARAGRELWWKVMEIE